MEGKWLMLNKISTRGKFALSAITVFLISILLVFFLPVSVTETLYSERANIVLLTPVTNMTHLLISLLFVIIALVLLALKRNVITYIIGTLFIIAGIIGSSFSVLNYTAIQDEQIVIKYYDGLASYPWSSIKEAVYEYRTGENGYYIFTTTDDQHIKIDETAKFTSSVKTTIYSTVRANDIPFIERVANE
jgi:hypothetical protein